MSSDQVDDPLPNGRVLTEDDVAGASLNGKGPNELTTPQLKRWLQCRGASTKGKKPDLVARLVLLLAR